MDDFEKHKRILLKNPEFRLEYEATRIEFEIARAIIRARLKNGFTQKQLADKLNTKQSVISRVEQGTSSPSISFLKRLASALNTTLQVKFV